MTRQGIATLCSFGIAIAWTAAASAQAPAVRQISPDVTVHESTQKVRDVNGRWRVSGRHVTRQSEIDGREDVVSETYARGEVSYDARPELQVRVRTSTTATADGGRNTVEEVEARNPATPGEPFRVTRRTVTTVRRAGPDRWAIERQVLERDVNGRMTAIQVETDETVGDAPR